MTLFGRILLACLILVALQYAVAALAFGLVAVIVWGLIWRPLTTIAWLMVAAFLHGLEVAPWWTIGASITLAAIFLVAGSETDPAEEPTNAVAMLPPPVATKSDRAP